MSSRVNQVQNEDVECSVPVDIAETQNRLFLFTVSGANKVSEGDRRRIHHEPFVNCLSTLPNIPVAHLK